MKKTELIFIILLLSFFTSCSNNNSKVSELTEKDSSYQIKNFIDTNLIDSARVNFDTTLTNINSPHQKTDSSKFIKAFDDIYFGTKASIKTGNPQYSVENIPFKILTSSYEDDFGLYTFILVSDVSYDPSEIDKSMIVIKHIIDIKYLSSRNMYEEFETDPIANLLLKEGKKQNENLGLVDNSDQGLIVNKLIWSKNNIIIKYGQMLDFEPIYGYETGISPITGKNELAKTEKIINWKKQIRHTLTFIYKPIMIELENKEKSRVDLEKKKEISKF